MNLDLDKCFSSFDVHTNHSGIFGKEQFLIQGVWSGDSDCISYELHDADADDCRPQHSGNRDVAHKYNVTLSAPSPSFYI